MRKLVVGALGALAVLSATQAKEERAKPPVTSRSASLDPSVEAQLEPALQRFETAWNNHDPKAMASTFADDAVLINPSGRTARGRDEIQQLFEDEHLRGAMRGTRFGHRVTDVRQIAPGVAFLDAEMTISGGRAPDGSALPDMRVHGALVFANQAGTWRVVEGRPYVFLPPPGSPAGVAGAGAPGAGTQSGTGSGASPSAEPSQPSGPPPASEPAQPSR